jgi:hypothetical protein
MAWGIGKKKKKKNTSRNQVNKREETMCEEKGEKSNDNKLHEIKKKTKKQLPPLKKNAKKTQTIKNYLMFLLGDSCCWNTQHLSRLVLLAPVVMGIE